MFVCRIIIPQKHIAVQTVQRLQRVKYIYNLWGCLQCLPWQNQQSVWGPLSWPRPDLGGSRWRWAPGPVMWSRLPGWGPSHEWRRLAFSSPSTERKYRRISYGSEHRRGYDFIDSVCALSERSFFMLQLCTRWRKKRWIIIQNVYRLQISMHCRVIQSTLPKSNSHKSKNLLSQRSIKAPLLKFLLFFTPHKSNFL